MERGEEDEGGPSGPHPRPAAAKAEPLSLEELLRKKEAIRAWRSKKEADKKAREGRVTQAPSSQEELSRQHLKRCGEDCMQLTSMP